MDKQPAKLCGEDFDDEDESGESDDDDDDASTDESGDEDDSRGVDSHASLDSLARYRRESEAHLSGSPSSLMSLEGRNFGRHNATLNSTNRRRKDSIDETW